MTALVYRIATALGLRFQQISTDNDYNTDAGAAVHVGRSQFDAELDTFPLIGIKVPKIVRRRIAVNEHIYDCEADFEATGVILQPQSDPAANPLALGADMETAAANPVEGDTLLPLISDIEVGDSEIFDAEDGATDAQAVVKVRIRWTEQLKR